jgi:PepSY-associated TM region
MSPRILLLRFLRRWHARIGFSAMLFFILLALTGFALNHGSALGLDAKYLHPLWLSRWYGIKSETPRGLFRAGRHQIVAANGRWMLDGKISGDRFPQPVGLVDFGDKFVVASAATLYVYRDDGSLVDRLESDALPGTPVEAAGSGGKGVVLRTPAGIFTSTELISWKRADGRKIAWSVPIELSAAEGRRFEEILRPGISVQQLLLDLHSGRFAGRYGPLFVDLLAVLLAVLSMSGAWLFLRPKRHRRDLH